MSTRSESTLRRASVNGSCATTGGACCTVAPVVWRSDDVIILGGEHHGGEAVHGGVIIAERLQHRRSEPRPCTIRVRACAIRCACARLEAARTRAPAQRVQHEERLRTGALLQLLPDRVHDSIAQLFPVLDVASPPDEHAQAVGGVRDGTGGARARIEPTHTRTSCCRRPTRRSRTASPQTGDPTGPYVHG